MDKKEILEKRDVLESPFEKQREVDKTYGTHMERLLTEAHRCFQQTPDEELALIKDMYTDSELKAVATDVAFELLWSWINDLRYDGEKTNDMMLMARAVMRVPGKHKLQCGMLTELHSGVDVMAGAIRHQLSRIWSFGMNEFDKKSKEE